MSDHVHKPTIIRNEKGEEIGLAVDDCGPDCKPSMNGGMPDLFEMSREGEDNAYPTFGEYVEGGHAAVVADVVIGDGMAWSRNKETGEQHSETIMLLGFETINGDHHMFTLRSDELVYLVEGAMRILPKMLEDLNPERNRPTWWDTERCPQCDGHVYCCGCDSDEKDCTHP